MLPEPGSCTLEHVSLKERRVTAQGDERETMPDTKSTTSRGADLRIVLREHLECDRTELLAQVGLPLEDALPPTATTGLGETEHIVTGIDRGVRAALDAHAASRLIAVDDALRRLDAGSYGQCERCASEIPGARLAAIPEVRLCMPCQEREDAARRRAQPR
jgi:DnaK suppressor protein